MNSEWKEYLLGEILEDYIRGPFGSSLKRDEMQEAGIPVYEQQNAIYDHRKFRYYINDEKFEVMKRFKVQKNDLIISCSGTIGKVSIIKENDPVGIISQALLILRPNTSLITPEFLYYYFSSHYGYYDLTSVSSGSVQVNVANRKIIEKTKIRLPPISEQIMIAKKLFSIDAMLLNQKTSINTTEQLISSIFRSWFIDFDPVKAKAEGKLPYGMDEEKAALFPDSFEDSDFGLIPKGWNWGTILDISDIWTGGTPKTSESSYWGGDIPWVSGADLSSNELFAFDSSRKITSLGVEKSSTKILPVGTVMITARGTVGATKITAVPMAMSQTSFGFKAKEGISDALIYQASQETIRQLRSFAYGAVFDTFTQSTIDITNIAIATLKILQAFGETVDPLFEHLKISAKNEIELATTRDALLPRLISGELKVN